MVDGESLVPLANGAERTSPVAMEYAAEASYAPLVSLRYGKWKYNAARWTPISCLIWKLTHMSW